MDLPVVDPTLETDSIGVKKPVSIAKLKAVQKPVLQDTLITPKGNILTKQQFLLSAKNGMPFTDMKTMGDWLDSWAHPVPNAPVKPIAQQAIPAPKQDYYSGYSTPGSGGMRYHQ